MIPTKRDQAPPTTPSKIEGSRQRLATLFAGFNLFGSPAKPVARADPSPYGLNVSHCVSDHPDRNEIRSPWRGKRCLMDLPDEVIINILSFLPNDQSHLILASWVNRRMNSLAQSPNLWSELLLNTPGPKLSEEYKTRATTMTAPGSWTASGVWTPKETSDEIHFPTLYQSRRLLDRVVRGRPLRGLPHVDTLHFSAPIYCVYAWGPWLILGGKDKAIQVWRTSTGNNELIESVPNAHDGSVLALAVDANAEGAKMVTGSSDGTARIWDIAWGREDVGISEVEGEPGSGWKVEVERKGTLTGHTAPVLDVALAKDFIITCSKDTTIRIYHRSTYALCRAIVGLHSGPVNCLALHPDPNIPEFISASGDGSWVRGPIEFPTFFARCQSVNSTIEGGQALACVGWGGPLVVTGSKDARLHAQDITGDGLFTMTRHTDSVRAVDLDVDESGAGTIVSASYDKTVVLWDACTGHERYVFEPHTSIILDVHLTNGRLITASHDQTVQIRTFGTDLPYRDLFV